MAPNKENTMQGHLVMLQDSHVQQKPTKLICCLDQDHWNVSSCLIFSPRRFLNYLFTSNQILSCSACASLASLVLKTYEPGGQHAPDRPHMWICLPGAALMTSICVTTIVSKLIKCDVNTEFQFNVCALFERLSALFEESCACNPRLLSRLSSLIEALSMFPSDLSDYLSLHALLQNN